MESHQHVLKNCGISSSNWVLKITWFNTKPWIYMYQLKLIHTSIPDPINSCLWTMLHPYTLCFGLAILSLPFSVASLALGQSYDCPSACEATLKDMGK